MKKKTKNNTHTCIICHNPTHIGYQDLFDDRYGAPGKHDIYICKKCGFGKTYPGLSRKEIGNFYAKYYPISQLSAKEVKASARRSSSISSWLSGTDNIAHEYVKPGEKVLDIGCGSGTSLIEISERGGDAYGVEPDPNGQRLAKKLGLTLHQGFITDDPFPKHRFDLITASQVIEHEPDPQKFLHAIKRKLDSCGKVILSFPNLNAAYRYLFGKKWLHWHIPYHLNFFTEKSIRELAKGTGFKVVKMRTITPNLWTILQLRMLTTPKEEGKPNRIWKISSNKKDSPSLTNFITRFLYLMQFVLLFGIMPINRLIDFLGYGESILIVLVKNEK